MNATPGAGDIVNSCYGKQIKRAGMHRRYVWHDRHVVGCRLNETAGKTDHEI